MKFWWLNDLVEVPARDDDLGAPLGQVEGSEVADAAAAPGDQGHLAVQPPVALVVPVVYK